MAQPEWKPEETLPSNPRDFKTPNYGLRTFAELFTARQLVALTTFADLVGEAREQVLADGGDETYAGAVTTYLAFGVDRAANTLCTLARWTPAREQTVTVSLDRHCPCLGTIRR